MEHSYPVDASDETSGTISAESHAKAIAKITSVLKFLQEFDLAKTPPIISLGEQPWKQYFDGLPNSSMIQVGAHYKYLKQIFDSQNLADGNFILKSGRPTETPCPPPPVVTENWLKPGWENPAVELGYHGTKTYKNLVGKTVTENFNDSPERLEGFDDWAEERRKWAADEINIHEALNVFGEYFDLWSKLRRESEKYQLVVGDGIFRWESPQGIIHHPLLIQKVQLEFNSFVPEFVVKDAVDPPTLHTALLRFMGVDGKYISDYQQILTKSHIHPLGGQETSDFLKELVQGLWPDGVYFEGPENIEDTQAPYVYRQPLIYLGRANQGYSDAVERYIQHLHQTDFIPESLVRIVGIDTGRSYKQSDPDAKPTEVLLTKEANSEQERVIRQLDKTGAVSVQGPPGTGKSHTIANLIGHLLAQNKSILIASHASKALRVVREKVVAPLRPLCVSLLDSDEESSKQLEESVTGIVDYLSRTSLKKTNAEIEKLEEKRADLNSRYSEIKGEIFAAMTNEYEEIALSGTGSVTPAQAAQQLHRDKKRYAWLPGPIEHRPDFPLSKEDMQELYEINSRLTAEDIEMLESTLPDPDQVPSLDEFREVFDALSGLAQENLKIGKGMWRHADHSAEQLRQLLDKVTQAMAVVDLDTPWVMECIDAGRRDAEEIKLWKILVSLVETLCAEIPIREQLVLSVGPKVNSKNSDEDIIRICQEICAHLKKGKSLSKLTKLLKPEWKEVIENCRVDGGMATEAEHFQAIINHLEINRLRTELRRRWDRQLEPLGCPASEKLGSRPEKTARQYIDKIKLAITWFDDLWKPCEELSQELGLKWKHLMKKAPVSNSAFSDLVQLKEVVTGELQPVIETRIKFIENKELNETKQKWYEYFHSLPKKEASYVLTKVFRGAVKKGNYDHYTQAWQRLHELIDLKPAYEKRQVLLSQLEPIASNWSAAIAGWESPHDEGQPPDDIQQAWTYRYLDQVLAKILTSDFDALQEKLDTVNAELQAITAQYIEKKSWRAQLERTGLKQQQALNGWLALHKKMGRGTGK